MTSQVKVFARRRGRRQSNASACLRGPALDGAGYTQLAKPSIAVPPTTYQSVQPNLFERIIEQTVSGSTLPNPLPHAGEGKVGAETGAAWCPPVQQAGG